MPGIRRIQIIWYRPLNRWLEPSSKDYIFSYLSAEVQSQMEKRFKNPAVKLSEAVAAERLKRAGVTLGPNLGITPPKERKASGFSRGLVKRLAGG